MSDKDDVQAREFVREDYVVYLDEKIGRGAFSKVYRAKYKDTIVAAKVINIKKMDKRVVTQLNRELKIISILTEYPHPNILKYYNVEKLPDYIIILMEICEGGDLKDVLEKGISERITRDLMKQLVRSYLHLLKFSIVHRDIKPTNILISNGVLKLIDFGLSKVLATDLTQTICGSPLYMAPEILYKQDYDGNADIWSMGILLYEMTYGFTPFSRSKDLKSLKYNILKSTIPFPDKNMTGEIVSNNCKQLMKSLLSISIKERIDWSTIDSHEWLKDEFIEYTIEANLPITDEKQQKKLRIIQDLQQKLKKDLRHEPQQAQNCDTEEMFLMNDSNNSSKSRPRLYSIESNATSNAVSNMSNVSNESNMSNSFEDERKLMGMGTPVVDGYIDKELEDVDTHKSRRSIPIPINKNFNNGSRLDFVDFEGFEFVNCPKYANIEVDTSSSITQYLYSRSAPIAGNIMSGINSLSKSFGKYF